MENAIATEYLRSVRKRFADAKKTGERAIDQLFWAPNAESNSIAVIIKHMSGNMISRWTDFFETDGEKPSRNRDGEFARSRTASSTRSSGRCTTTRTMSGRSCLWRSGCWMSSGRA